MTHGKSTAFKIAALAVTVALASTGSLAQTTTKIGVLNDQSSLYADLNGLGSVVAAKMAIEDSGIEKRGFKIEVISADHLGPGCLGLQQERGEVVGVERHADLADHFAAVGFDDRGGVAFERVPEGVVGGEEEPGVAAGRRHRLAGAIGERPGVVSPVDRIGVAFRAGEVRCRGARHQEQLVLLAAISLTASATPEFGTSTITSTLSTSNQVPAMFEPTSGLF